ncbi:MAG: phospholipid carrier-dependent glycosyltransferase [Anaerolineae bacterium]|nr:phospholipid carrier-dependent glycosyltransferase [Anaerolineae bacterium]
MMRKTSWPAALMAFMVAWYLWAVLPHLGQYPPPNEWGEMEIMAPAYKLATQGVYGTDLFAGFYRAEQHNYVFMPLFPVLLAGVFKLIGLGLWQARLFTIVCGLLTVLLTYGLGRKLFNSGVGAVAAAALCTIKLSVDERVTGMPLLDIARVVRFDVLVPVWVLLACLCFAHAHQQKHKHQSIANRFLFLCGVCVGLAGLSHVYGLLSCRYLWGCGCGNTGGERFVRWVCMACSAVWLWRLCPGCCLCCKMSRATSGKTCVTRAGLTLPTRSSCCATCATNTIATSTGSAPTTSLSCSRGWACGCCPAVCCSTMRAC